jgi:thermitase
VVAATATAAPWTLTLDTHRVVGSATLTVTATGADGTSKGVATLSVYGDHASPLTSFRILPSVMTPAPISGLVMIGARASDDVGVARVQLFAGSRLIGTDATSPYAFGWQSAAYNGPVTLTLRAYDRAGNLSIARSVVTTDNTAPTVSVTKAAANGTRHVGSVQYVTAGAADHYGVRLIELLVNGKVTQAYGGRSVRFRLLTAPYGRTMRVQIRAYDTAGNVRYTPARTWYR